jgi:OmcA/MtrC family decaheme c-type cytochrome
MIGIGLAALILVGCNGSRGQTGATASAVPVISASALSATDWAGLNLTGKVTSVNMNQGKPQVTFTVTNNDASPVAGLSANASSTTLSTGAPLVSYPNFAFTIAKLVPGSGGNSQWVSYIISSTPSSTAAAVPNHPSSDNTGTLAEDGLGNYTYTFYRDITQAAAFLQAASYSAAKNQVQSDLGDVSYQPTLTHRIGISVGGAFRGTGSNTANGTASSTAAVYPNRSANLIYDFVPATGQVAANAATKVVVDKAACEACHTKLGVSFHTGGAMNDPRYCDTCHTDQQKFGQVDALPASGTVITASGSVKLNGMAVGNMTGFIHRLHMGSNLSLTGYNFAGVKFNAITYPQDVRNCSTCHTGSTPQSGNYLTVPSVAACGACHDGVNFATGAGHGPANLPQLSDAACAGCHASDDIKVEHTPILTPTQASATAYQATNPANLPTGAHSVYAKVSSVTLVANAVLGSLGNPKITFSLFADNSSTPLTINPTPSVTTSTAMIAPLADGTTFSGGPNILVAMGYPQDGIAPADFNYETTFPLVNVWSGASYINARTGLAVPSAVGTLVSLGGGVYTLTLTGIAVPSGTNLLIAGFGEGSTLTHTNLGLLSANAPNPASDPATNFTSAGLLVPFPTIWAAATFPVVASGPVNSLTRRTIVSTDACNSCHSNLGAFTATNFHSQANNDATSCAICHNTAHANANGYSINAKDWVHGLHAGGFRSYPYVAYPGFPNITYPGILNNCEACHVAGSYDFSNSANAAQIPNMLWDTIATSASSPTISGSAIPAPVNTQGNAVVVNPNWVAPLVTPGASYGIALVNNTPSPTVGLTFTAPTQATLVSSPITAACASCHDSQGNIAHMTSATAGGVYYTPRSSVSGAGVSVTVNGVVNLNSLKSNEACLSCHGHGAAEDIAVVHANY